MIWNEHVKNRSAFSPQELRKYHGRYVAWNCEGTRIVTSGDDDLQAFNAALAAGYDPAQVVFSYVPFPDEVVASGADLLPGDLAE